MRGHIIVKNLAAVLTVVVLAITCVSLLSDADDSCADIVHSGNYEGEGILTSWALDSDGVLTVSGTGAVPDFVPHGAPYDSYRADIASIVIGDGVTSLGTNSFYGLGNVVTATIGDGVTSIGNSAFESCDNLSTVTFGSSLETIGQQAFMNCNITSVSFPESIRIIDGNAFSNNEMEALFIPEGLEQLNRCAFSGCSNLERIQYNAVNAELRTTYEQSAFENAGTSGLELIIGDKVTTIPNHFFKNVTSLKSLTIGSSLAIDPSGNNGYQAFMGCTGIETILYKSDQGGFSTTAAVFSGAGSVDNGIKVTFEKRVPYQMFYNCTTVRHVVIEENVDTVDSGGAFMDMDSIQQVDYYSKKLESVNDLTFHNTLDSESCRITATFYSGSVIPDYIFSGCETLQTVIIEDGVESIGSRAFYSSGLSSVTIGADVASIGINAFAGCALETIVYHACTVSGVTTDNNLAHYAEGCSISISGTSGKTVSVPTKMFTSGSYWLVTELNIGEYVPTIGDDAFRGLRGITDLTLSEGISTIGSGAFYGCSGLTELDIPDSVTTIGASAFDGCSNVTSLTIGPNVTSVGNYAFNTCSAVTEFHYGITSTDASLFGLDVLGTFFGSSDGYALYIDSGVTALTDKPFKESAKIKNLSLPNGLLTIGNYAFYKCTGITSVTIPDSVTSIGSGAFQGCTGITSITLGSGTDSLGSSAFSGCTGVATLTYSKTPTTIDIDCFNEFGTGTLSVTVNDGVTAIKSGMVPVTAASVTIADSVTSIGNYAFDGCYKLKSIGCSGAVTIGEYAFSGCSGLTSFTFGSGVTTIGDRAFEDCTGLTSLTIEHQMTWGSDVFVIDGDEGKLDVTFSGTCTSIPDSLMIGCKILRSVNIGGNITSVGESAFRQCNHLATVTIGNSVTELKTSAFESAPIATLTIGTGLTTVGSSALSTCRAITELNYNATALVPNNIMVFSISQGGGCTVKIGNNVTSIPDNLFSGCSKITSVTIGSSVATIGQNAFNGCSMITSISIPHSVTSIGKNAFRDCTGLTEVIYNGAVAADYGKYDTLFPNSYTMNVTLTIGNDVTRIPAYMFYSFRGVRTLTIGTGVTEIGSNALYGYSNLATVNFNATDLPQSGCGDSVFGQSPTGAVTLNIGEGVKHIPNIFYFMNITSVTIPSSVLSIAGAAFGNSLTSVTFNAVNCADAEDNVFSDLLETITFGSGVERIPGFMFAYGTGLTSVTIPDTVTEIGAYAFYGMGDITSITIPVGVKTIREYAFAETGLTSISLPNTVTTVEEGAFSDCVSLRNVIVMSGTIGESAFAGCGITTAQLNVTEIGPQAFIENGLQDIVFGDLTTVSADAFDGIVFKDFDGTTTLEPTAANLKNCTFSGENGVLTKMGISIIFDSNGGSEIQSIKGTEGSTIPTPLPVSERAGYEFAGWFKDNTLTEPFDLVVFPSSNITVYAKWDVITLTITFVTPEGPDVPARNFTVETDTFDLDIPVWSHHTFGGWFDAETGGTQYTTITRGSVTESLTLYERWSLTVYTVTFIDDSGETERTYVDNGSAPSIDEPTVTPRAHYNASWPSYVLNYEDIEVQANYDPIVYHIVFKVDGVEFDVQEYTVVAKHIDEPVPTPKDHYSVVWESYDLNLLTDQTVNAIYAPITYTITFRQGSTNTPIQYTIEDHDFEEPPIVPREHYNVVWEPYELEYNDSQVVGTNNYPIWYTVTFVDDYGERERQYSEVEFHVVPPTVTERAGYTAYWPEFVLDYTDFTVTAVYVKNAEVVHNPDGSYSVNGDGSQYFNADTLTEIVDAAAADSTVTMNVKIGDISASFDNAALRAISKTGASLSLEQASAESLSDAEKAVIGDRPAFRVDFGSNKDFAGGKVTYTLPYTLKDGEDPANLKILYISDGKVAETIPCTYADGKVTFTVGHMSLYSIGYEVPESGSGGGGEFPIWIVIVIVVVVAAAGVGVFFFVKNKKA